MRTTLPKLLLVISCASLFFANVSTAQDQPDVKRKIVSQVLPLYPELARKMNLTGTVKVLVTVAPAGKVKDTQILGGSPVLAKAAVEALYKWRWVVASQETKEIIQLDFHP